MVATKKQPLLMTEGPLFGKILLFILPLMATNLLQTFYNAADMIVVGLSSEADAVGAIGTTAAYLNLILNVFLGFATGATVVVARHLGATENDRASRTVHTSLVVALLFGAVSALIGLSVSRPVLMAMGAEANLLKLAVRYTYIYLAGVPFLAITNYLIAILRAKGDTKTPLLVLSLAGLLNVLLNLFFVLALDLSVEGVALATTAANLLSAILLLLKLSRDEGPCRFHPKLLCFDISAFKKIVYIGLPAGVQGALFALSNMLIQSSILQVNNAVCSPDSTYQPIVKANAAVGNIEGFIYTAQNSVYQAAITFTSQNMGAAKYRRIKRVLLSCIMISTLVTLIFSSAIFLLRAPLLALYDVVPGAPGTLEALAFDAAITRLLYVCLPYFLIAIMESACGVVRGLGKSISSTVISLMGACLFRVVWLLTVFPLFPTLETIFISYPISWSLTAAAQIVCAALGLRHLIKTKKTEEEIRQMILHH